MSGPTFQLDGTSSLRWLRKIRSMACSQNLSGVVDEMLSGIAVLRMSISLSFPASLPHNKYSDVSLRKRRQRSNVSHHSLPCDYVALGCVLGAGCCWSGDLLRAIARVPKSSPDGYVSTYADGIFIMGFLLTAELSQKPTWVIPSQSISFLLLCRICRAVLQISFARTTQRSICHCSATPMHRNFHPVRTSSVPFLPEGIH